MCSVASLTVTPPTWTGSSTRERVQVAELADVPLDACSVVTAVVGGNFQAIAQRGSRPTTPRRRCSSYVVDLDHHAVDLEVERAAALLPGQALGDDLVLGVELLDVGVDAEAVLAQPLQRLPVARERDPLGRADPVAPHRQRPLGGERGSSWRIVPAAELRGFMNVDSPASARRSLSAAKSGSDM